jgi:putative membrane protein
MPEPAASGLADLRELQANERTLLAWVRTSISLVSFGFAIAQLADWIPSQGRQRPWAGPIVLGAIFAFLGAAAQIAGIARYLSVRRALLAGRPPPVAAMAIVTLSFIVTALGLLVGAYIFR